MITEQSITRHQLLQHIRHAKTLSDCDEAGQAFAAYSRAHPDEDVGVMELGSMLAKVQDAISGLAAGKP